MHWRELKQNIGVVTSLATVGVVLSIGLTTAGLIYVAGWDLLPALILGVLISATDPVSVIATFKEAGVTGRLRLLVEAESLFNDGTVAVIFGLAVAAVGATAAITPVGVATTFLVTVFGGLACGALVGYGAILLPGAPTIIWSRLPLLRSRLTARFCWPSIFICRACWRP